MFEYMFFGGNEAYLNRVVNEQAVMGWTVSHMTASDNFVYVCMSRAKKSEDA